MRWLFALFILLPTSAIAGNLESFPNAGYDDCRYRFTGEIQAGDLTDAIDDLTLTESGGGLLCLDSPGGSLAEVFAFIELIRTDLLIGTRIEAGASCMSSCALLFMFGQGFGANSPHPRREIEPGGRLGFHSPFIATPGARVADVTETFQLGMQVAKLLADNAYTARTSSGPAMPPEVQSLVLGTPPKEMRFVETIGEAKILGIDVVLDQTQQRTRIPRSQARLVSTARRICASSYVLTYRTHHVQDGYNFDDLLKEIKEIEAQEVEVHHVISEPDYSDTERVQIMLSGAYYVPGWFSAGATLFCHVDLNTTRAGKGYLVNHYFVSFGGPTFDWDSRIATFEDASVRGLDVGLIPVDTPIADLATQ